MTARLRLTQGTLLFCVFLYVFTETLLSPFYPQFFRQVFGVEDLAYAGYYIFACRLTVALCAPLWGLLTRRFDVRYLLLTGQACATLFTSLLPLAGSAEQFLVLSVLLLAFKSSYMLLYPLLVQIVGQSRSAAVAGNYHAVFHGAIVLSSLAGVWMINLPNPLTLFYWVAATDLLQLLLCLYLLKTIFVPSPVSTTASASRGHIGERVNVLLALGLAIFTFHLAANLVRPYFTEYTRQDFSLSLGESSLVFLVPSVMAILAAPYIRRACLPESLPRLYSLGFVVLISSLLMQALAENLFGLVASRVLYGFSLAVTQAALEVQLWIDSRQEHLKVNYGMVASFQNLGLLTAPLLASSLVSIYGLAMPFLAAAAICVLNLALTRLTVFRGTAFRTAYKNGVIDGPRTDPS